MLDFLSKPLAVAGRGTIGALGSVGRAWALFAASAGSMRHVDVWGPHLFPQMARVGVASVPIALFIATFTGIVMSLQASYTLTGTIPLYFVGTLVGKTMIMELGPVLTGLTLAGRVGASISAELGTMRVTEQVDALETLAYDPLAYLVVPRVLAGILMFPIVVLLAVAIGIASGWFTALQLLDMSTAEFVKGSASSSNPGTCGSRSSRRCLSVQWSPVSAASTVSRPNAAPKGSGRAQPRRS